MAAGRSDRCAARARRRPRRTKREEGGGREEERQDPSDVAACRGDAGKEVERWRGLKGSAGGLVTAGAVAAAEDADNPQW
mmetsp:Transcript_3569/g.8914  ORF Transcript_3569/g.8914 Transcript_3569/m.8914 type:complete len:80 (+) Transcript_3569:1526-1765(+)